MKVLRFCKWDSYTLNNLEENQLYFSKPLYFNDPFDGRAVNLYRFKSFDTVYELIAQYLKKSSKKSELTELIPKMISSAKHEKLYESIWNPEKIKEFDDIFIAYNLLKLISMIETNVFCTSKKEIMITTDQKYFLNDASLLFSHYSNSHHGIVLEYDFESIPELKPSLIEYKDAHTSPIIDEGMVNKILAGDCKELFISKSTAWKYEAEVRFFHDNQIFKFEQSNIPLKNIYLGVLCSYENITIIKEIIKSRYNSSVGLYQAKQKMDNFKLEIIKISL